MKTLLRPSDIAWQAFQAGARFSHSAEYSGHYKLGDPVKFDRMMNGEFQRWWSRHPQTTEAGELKPERKQRKAKP